MKKEELKKWIVLIAITACLLILGKTSLAKSLLHESYFLTVVFFAIQALILFRLDSLISNEWAVQVSLIKIIVRFLTSATFVLVMIYQYMDPFDFVIQFVIIYLVYMIFEIGVALIILRRNSRS